MRSQGICCSSEDLFFVSQSTRNCVIQALVLLTTVSPLGNIGPGNRLEDTEYF